MSIQTAAPLLAFIRKTETGRNDPNSYDTVFGHHPTAKPLTDMTLDEVISAGPDWSHRYKSSAAGAYQFMTATLKDLKVTENVGGNVLMNAQTQDILGYALLKRRGFERFMEGRLGTIEFARALAKEWASFPVLADTNGAVRAITRGQSFYAGDGLNKALVTPGAIELILRQVRDQAAPSPSEPPDAPLPVQPTIPSVVGATRPVGWIIALVIAAALAALWYFFVR